MRPSSHSKDSKSLVYPLCKLYYRESFTLLRELYTIKRSRLAGEGRPRPTKRIYISRRRLLRQKTEDLIYKFIDERKRLISYPTLLKAPEDNTLLSSWCSVLKNSLNNKNALSDGADNEDWEHIGKVNYLESNHL
ncbi:hypothetical protein V2W45_1468330 [Cenococcum geophilum]